MRAFNHNNLIQDQFSKIDNQHVVKSESIQWLKATTHVMLDMICVQA